MAGRHVRGRYVIFARIPANLVCVCTRSEIHRGDRYRDQRHDRLVGRKSRFPRGNHRE